MKTYYGGCDCGKVKFEVGLDLEKGTFKCNCRICSKIRFWGIGAKAEDFKLLSGEESLSRYGKNKIHHFCKVCGTKLFGRPVDAPRVAVSVAALDGIPPEELDKLAAGVRYFDGIHDNWQEAPAHTAYL